MSAPMDAVYILGPQQMTPELRYSLRSLANLPMVDRVVIAGFIPTWVTNVETVPVPQTQSKHRNTWANVRAAMECDRLSPDVVLMNDDFYVLRPVQAIPVLHRGPLADIAANHRRSRNAVLSRRKEWELGALRALGYPNPNDYELHVPMVVNRKTMIVAMDAADRLRPGGADPTGKRTFYAAFAGLNGTRADDCKIRGHDDLPGDGWTFLSTADGALRAAVGRWLRAKFPEPSRYERGAGHR